MKRYRRDNFLLEHLHPGGIVLISCHRLLPGRRAGSHSRENFEMTRRLPRWLYASSTGRWGWLLGNSFLQRKWKVSGKVRIIVQIPSIDKHPILRAGIPSGYGTILEMTAYAAHAAFRVQWKTMVPRQDSSLITACYFLSVSAFFRIVGPKY